MKFKNFEVMGKKERIKREKDTKKQIMLSPYFCSSGYRGLFPGGGGGEKEREADHAPTSAKIKKAYTN
jgi:hypothetical protein